MNVTSASVIDAALQLSVKDRAEVAAIILDSLPSTPSRSPAEIDEIIARRIQEVESGQVEMIPWEQARRMIHGDL